MESLIIGIFLVILLRILVLAAFRGTGPLWMA